MADQPSSVENNIVKCHSILARHEQDCGDPWFITYTRYFHIDGPNGRHLCLVLPFYGRNLHSLSNYMKSRMKPRFVQAHAYQETEILRDLHTRGICIGISDQETSFSEFAIWTISTTKEFIACLTESGRIPDPEAPRYVVGFLDFMLSGEDVLLNELCLIGFDHAFEISLPKTIAPLPEFLAPNVAVGKPASLASDVWTLGLTILNMRSGISLFPCHVDCSAHLITECVKYFGILPRSWEEPFYDEEGRPTSDKTKGCPREVSDEIHSLKQWTCDIWDESTQANENESTPAAPFMVRDEDRSLPDGCDWLSDDISPVINYNPQDIDQLAAIHDNTERSYPKHYAKQVWEPSAFKINGTYLPEGGGVGWFTYLPGNSDVEDNLQSLPRISTQEADMLYDLLRKIFVYEGRISAENILGHPWFEMV
ncbi:hypothetical protein FVEG_07497 [Fusarium verticillioides 7600]|uniref:Protein kinase domain-containing protein n=1 Tax=Gibberella moniliformis (strain M3125 / FGSC 7600) TaxID=334819 RepID=W7MIE6_GIBM7|nr:hypothetical protein FVEG_07497 [Fusarium verticillioides 7600]EWG47369.1 hypothetical protein FVEG_07497 [Fusarium verticillioides 7600]